jgi:tetratricopeptide (TPR) repeat protein
VKSTGRLPAIAEDYSAEIDSSLQKRDYADAMPQLRMALDLDFVNEHIVNNNLGNALGAQGLVQQAADHYQEALRIRPGYATAHYNLAKVLAAQGEVESAEVHYRRALELRPDHVDAHNNLANLLAGAGRFDAAIPHYREALRLRPDYAEAHSNLGWALKSVGRLDEALQHFREASRLNPGFAAPAIGAAWILAAHPLAERRNARQAIQLAEDAARSSGREDPLTLDTLAVAYAAGGQFEHAVRFAQAARNLAAANGQSDLAGDIDRRLELYRQARPYLEVHTGYAAQD